MHDSYLVFIYKKKKGELVMAEIDSKKIVGDTFEDMDIWEMTLVQGSGDVEPNSLTAVSAALTSAAATWAFSKDVVKCTKGKC